MGLSKQHTRARQCLTPEHAPLSPHTPPAHLPHSGKGYAAEELRHELRLLLVCEVMEEERQQLLLLLPQVLEEGGVHLLHLPAEVAEGDCTLSAVFAHCPPQELRKLVEQMLLKGGRHEISVGHVGM